MQYFLSDILKAVAYSANGNGLNIECEQGREDALDLVHRCDQRFLDTSNGGDWRGTHADVCFPVQDCCVTLDSRFHSITAARIMGYRAEIFSRGFKYLEGGTGGVDCEDCFIAFEDIGRFPTIRELPFPMHIVAGSDRNECEGAEIVIYGFTEEGKEAYRTVLAGRKLGYNLKIKRTSNRSDSLYYTGGDQWTSGRIKQITAIKKPRTKGYIDVWGYEPQTKELYWLTTLKPDETQPSLRRYKLSGVKEEPAILQAHVLLNFVRLYNDDDIALIQNPEAYTFMARALHLYSVNDYQNAQIAEAQAFRLLNGQNSRDNRGTFQTLNVIKMRMNPFDKLHRYGVRLW